MFFHMDATELFNQVYIINIMAKPKAKKKTSSKKNVCEFC